AALERLTADGAQPAATVADLVAALDPPRVVWLMVPAGLVARVVSDLAPRLDAGDVLVDGGNSHWRDDVDRAATLAEREIAYVDVGVSGGVHGRERGYCLMVGGDATAVAHLAPVLTALAPGVDAAARTPGRTGDPAPEEQGWLHCGPPGAGHFVKMVHNGIEYGIMAAYAEGMAILRAADQPERAGDAETAPLREPAYYRYDLDVAAVAEVWRRGSVIGSWLLDLTAVALREDPDLAGFAGRVADSGEGRWSLQAAIDEGVPTPVLASALFQRFTSRDQGDYADRVLSAMRVQFGGHEER
ncbi:MAG TPA: decarboxylating 6-phosphogluconate dehydrogenase, partial [Euzebyales bacterium]|nr:decarboxylating 6-phosphogluconate dehydrogenase [Euzebyales bacterium]